MLYAGFVQRIICQITHAKYLFAFFFSQKMKLKDSDQWEGIRIKWRPWDLVLEIILLFQWAAILYEGLLIFYREKSNNY